MCKPVTLSRPRVAKYLQAELILLTAGIYHYICISQNIYILNISREVLMLQLDFIVISLYYKGYWGINITC